jgi:hypothetical protein
LIGCHVLPKLCAECVTSHNLVGSKLLAVSVTGFGKKFNLELRVACYERGVCDKSAIK